MNRASGLSLKRIQLSSIMRADSTDEAGYRQIPSILAVGQKFVPSHHPELWQGPSSVRRVLDSAWRGNALTSANPSHDDSRVRRPLARSRPGKKLRCAKAGGSPVVLQILRARRNAERKPGPP